MQQIRGHITLRSSPEHGTVVALYFPIADASDPEAAQGGHTEQSRRQAAP
jgi:hypothetical protein